MRFCPRSTTLSSSASKRSRATNCNRPAGRAARLGKSPSVWSTCDWLTTAGIVKVAAQLFLHARLHGDDEFVRQAVRFGDEFTAAMASLLALPRRDSAAAPFFEPHPHGFVIAMIAPRSRVLYGRAETRTDVLREDPMQTTVARMLWLELSTAVEEVRP